VANYYCEIVGANSPPFAQHLLHPIGSRRWICNHNQPFRFRDRDGLNNTNSKLTPMINTTTEIIPRQRRFHLTYSLADYGIADRGSCGLVRVVYLNNNLNVDDIYQK